MNRSSWVAFSLVGVFALAALFLPACNTQDPPVAPGLIANSKPCGTLGNNTVGVTITNATDLFFYPVVPTSNSTLYELSVYTASAGSVTFEAGIYSNGAGKPASLLAETGPQTVSAPATLWNTVTLKHFPALSAGVTYWLSYEASPANSVPDNLTSIPSIPYCFQPQGVFGILPSSFTGIASDGHTFSVYGTTCP